MELAGSQHVFDGRQGFCEKRRVTPALAQGASAGAG